MRKEETIKRTIATTFRLNPELKRRLRMHCADNGDSMLETVELALWEFLKRSEKRAK